ncbi:hypothetical protein CLLI_19870 [Clostridium liquoris]|uniref:Translocation protein TolB n=1 Tax=Clostridium liquoris TaxID=1289519 RepID=A0A2T0B2S1_9CLOT|nr:hypothetical protein [Clostridium liquoris]PRR78067.1 hypothetical protein CLLI_19870 [Clostridium liquoris]
MKMPTKNTIITSLLIVVIFFIFIFSHESRGGYDKVFVLDNSNFNDDILSNEEEKKMTLENVQKVPFNGNCDSCDFFDKDNIIYSKRNGQGSFLDVNNERLNYYGINILNLKTNREEKLIPVENKSQRFIIPSPDKKRIFYSEGEEILEKDAKYKEEENKSYIYNVKSKEKINIPYKTFIKWMPDSSGYIGIKDSLFLQDFNKGISKEILDYKQLKKIENIQEISIAKDCQNIFIQGFKSDEDFSSYIYNVNLDKPYEANLVLKGNIKRIEAIDNNNLIFSGKYWGEKGLYNYNLETKEIKKLLDGDIVLFKLSNDKKSIAYVVKDKDGNNILYAAKLYKNSISESVMLYKNLFIKYYTLNWSEDNKRLIAAFYEEKEEKDNKIYIFHFR